MGYVDCYATDMQRTVSHAEFVETFYTGSVFKLERWLLKLFAAKASTDEDARQLAAGTRQDFSAWTVEGRATDQLLMCDVRGRTRSWLMVSPRSEGVGTRLYFGSAVIASKRPTDSKLRLGIVFTMLLGFHKVYSKVLLSAARARLAQSHACES